MEAILVATLRQHCPDCRGLARARSSIDAMKVLAAPSPTPAPTGRLREWNGGVPGHGEFVMLKTQPTDGSAPLEFSSKFRFASVDEPRRRIAFARSTADQSR